MYDDVEYIISYVKSGESINKRYYDKITDYIPVGSDFVSCGTRTEVKCPLDYVQNSDIERYLRSKGALTLKELEKKEALEEEEERRLRRIEQERLRKENEERIKMRLDKEL